jgi:hypothetical protein
MGREETRRRVLGLGLTAVLAGCTTAEQDAILRGVLGSRSGGAASGLTSAEAVEGLKAALSQGVGYAVARAGQRGGYYQNGRIRIPLPPRLAAVQTRLRPLGLSGLLDDIELKMNRAAETAAPEARSIFLDAIAGMSIDDALSIVRGGPTAATDYFERRTTPRLVALFSPPMQDALQGTGAIQAFDDLVTRLEGVPLAPQLGAGAKQDLIDHAVMGGLDGLFTLVAEEERAIRENPAKRGSEILRKVFG